MNRPNTEQIFTHIFKTNAWRSAESRSGPGSSLKVTKRIRQVIQEILSRHQIRTFLDIPCGDFNWMKEVDLDGIEYTGADIVADLIANNSRLFGSANIQFQQMDLINSVLPRVDLIMVRDCLVHLSFDDCYSALEGIRNSDSRYFLSTTFPQILQNEEIETGDFRRINLQLPPFNFPKPIEIYSENHDVDRDPRKCLGLWEIASI